jgi:hypothetical protein
LGGESSSSEVASAALEVAGFAGHIMEIRLSARYQWEGFDSPPFFDKTFLDSRITIGNDPAASLCLNGSVLSAEQIVIIEGETEPQLMNQAEGTSLNGEALALNECRPLRDGDLLCIGTYQISIFLNKDSSTPGGNPRVQANGYSIAQRNASNSQFVEDGLTEFSQTHQSDILLNSGEITDSIPPGGNHQPKPSKSFAAILDSLRTDEDRFYFIVEGGEQSGVRISIELEEMPLGWDESGENLCFNISAITDLCAVVRKDWSGVILRTPAHSSITVNNEPLEDERRLRDGDRLLLKAPNKEAGTSQVVLVFREPTSLVILDSLMPRVPPLAEDAAFQSPESVPGAPPHISKPTRKLASLIKSDKEYFTVFTFVELSLMAVGTLVGAVIIFLILTYS